jgi:predicted small integral membrane protein
MWKSTIWNGLETPPRNFVLPSLALIFVHLPTVAMAAPDNASLTPV